MKHSLLQLCWYHQGIQKTAKFKCLANTDEAKTGLRNVDLILGHISDGVEDATEYDISLHLLFLYVEKLHNEGVFSDEMLKKITEQIVSVDNNKDYIVNYMYNHTTHLYKRTTTANECRHRNLKHGDNPIALNNLLAQSANKQNTKRKASTISKLVSEASNVESNPLWAKGVDNVSPLAARLLFTSWNNRGNYANVRIDKITWVVMRHNPKRKKMTSFLSFIT